MILATWVTRQLVFDGVASGLVFGLLALGNMGLVGAGLFVLLAVQYGVPYWLSAVVALAVGALYGAVVELVVVRRLFSAPRVILLVATIGIAQPSGRSTECSTSGSPAHS